MTGVGREGVGGVAFSSDSTRSVLAKACDSIGIISDSAELLRLGENAIYRLKNESMVVRIARTIDHLEDATKEVDVANWLSSMNFPTARPIEVRQPIVIDGHPVTFWEFISGRPGDHGDIAELGRVLRRVHETPPPINFQLPPKEILSRVKPRIESASVSKDEKDFLFGRCSELHDKITRLSFPLPRGPIHGDAHVNNLMIVDGGSVLIDLERFAWGQPEWDLAMTATEWRTAGWWNDAEYREFVDAYGYDVTEWSGFEVLQATLEISMTTWLMQNIHESAEIAAEYQVRMSTLRTGKRDRPWKPF